MTNVKLIPQSRIIAALMMLALLSVHLYTQAQSVGAGASPGSALSIPQGQLLQPEALNQMLQTSGVEKPLVLQVGSHVLYAEAHIPGAEYAGAGGQPEGLQQLKRRVASLPRKSFIVLYCGCCPWNRCPNIAPAFRQLNDMGFTNVKVLYLADNLGTNWVDKGYRVEQGR